MRFESSGAKKGRTLHFVRYEAGDQHWEDLKERKWRPLTTTRADHKKQLIEGGMAAAKRTGKRTAAPEEVRADAKVGRHDLEAASQPVAQAPARQGHDSTSSDTISREMGTNSGAGNGGRDQVIDLTVDLEATARSCAMLAKALRTRRRAREEDAVSACTAKPRPKPLEPHCLCDFVLP